MAHLRIEVVKQLPKGRTLGPSLKILKSRLSATVSSLPPALTLLISLNAREGAEGQAVVCPLLRGSSPTRAVAPKQHRGLRRAFSPAFFGTGSLYPLARGCRRSWRGEGWFRRARCCSTGSGRPGFDFLNFDFFIFGAPLYLTHPPSAREGADGQAVVCPLLRGTSQTRLRARDPSGSATASPISRGQHGWF